MAADMKPDQVPADLIRQALGAYFNDGRDRLDDYDGDDIRGMGEALAVVIPAVREQVAKEIEAHIEVLRGSGHPSAAIVALHRAARIARGGA